MATATADGVRDAVAAFTVEIAPLLAGRDVHDLDGIDAALRELDGTPSLERIGADAVLAASVACSLASAASRDLPLWRALGDGEAPLLPMPMVNMISGGAHAGRLVDFQDLLVVPVGARTFAEAIEWATRVRAATAAAFRDRGHDPSLVADEGGLAARLRRTAPRSSCSSRASSAAAWHPGGTRRSRSTSPRPSSCAATATARERGAGADRGRTHRRSVRWVDAYPVVSIEDLCGEDEEDGWRYATERLGTRIQLLGDDLFVTNPERLRPASRTGRERGALKPNQIGTLATTRTVVGSRARPVTRRCCRRARARRRRLACRPRRRLAHRPDQGRLDDRSERTAKWNRLLRIEAEAPDATLAPMPSPRMAAQARANRP